MRHTNNAKAILTNATPYSTTATQITLPTGKGALFGSSFPYEATYEFSDSNGNVLEREILLVTNRSGDTLTIVRAYDYCPISDSSNTQVKQAVQLKAGGIIEARVTAGWMDGIEDDISTLDQEKADDSGVVHISGDETINGIKTFNGEFLMNGILRYSYDKVKVIYVSLTATGDGSGKDSSNYAAWNGGQIVNDTAYTYSQYIFSAGTFEITTDIKVYRRRVYFSGAGVSNTIIKGLTYDQDFYGRNIQINAIVLDQGSFSAYGCMFETEGPNGISTNWSYPEWDYSGMIRCAAHSSGDIYLGDCDGTINGGWLIGCGQGHLNIHIRACDFFMQNDAQSTLIRVGVGTCTIQNRYWFNITSGYKIIGTEPDGTAGKVGQNVLTNITDTSKIEYAYNNGLNQVKVSDALIFTLADFTCPINTTVEGRRFTVSVPGTYRITFTVGDTVSSRDSTIGIVKKNGTQIYSGSGGIGTNETTYTFDTTLAVGDVVSFWVTASRDGGYMKNIQVKGTLVDFTINL